MDEIDKNFRITTFLAMTSSSGSINAKLPPVSYTKAIDVWIGVCLAFIFGALLEFSLGEYSCLRLELNLRREYSYYVIQLYIPCIMLVVVSFVSFWIDKDSVPARVSLGVTSFLAMITASGGINQKLPPVSYVKAVDIWIGVCLSFIFGALLEYSLGVFIFSVFLILFEVNYTGRLELMKKSKIEKKAYNVNPCICPPTKSKSSALIPMAVAGMDTFNFNTQNVLEPSYTNGTDDGTGQLLGKAKFFPSLRLDLAGMKRSRRGIPLLQRFILTRWIFREQEISKRIDLVSRITFPTCFIVFLIYYYYSYFDRN